MDCDWWTVRMMRTCLKNATSDSKSRGNETMRSVKRRSRAYSKRCRCVRAGFFSCLSITQGYAKLSFKAPLKDVINGSIRLLPGPGFKI